MGWQLFPDCSGTNAQGFSAVLGLQPYGGLVLNLSDPSSVKYNVQVNLAQYPLAPVCPLPDAPCMLCVAGSAPNLVLWSNALFCEGLCALAP